MKNAIFGIVVTCAAVFSVPGIARAQSVTLACEPSNICFSDATGIAYNAISWSINTSQAPGAIVPQNCSNKTVCRWYCPTRPGRVTATVNYRNNGVLVGSATAQTGCTAHDL